MKFDFGTYRKDVGYQQMDLGSTRISCFFFISTTDIVLQKVCMYVPYMWLQWSRGSVLAFGTQFRGFKPGQSRQIFQDEKILSTPSFRREVKPFVPCHIFVACKRTQKCMRGSRSFLLILMAISHPSSSSFHYQGLWWRHLAVQVGTTKDQGLYNKPQAAVHPGALAARTLPHTYMYCI